MSDTRLRSDLRPDLPSAGTIDHAAPLLLPAPGREAGFMLRPAAAPVPAFPTDLIIPPPRGPVITTANFGTAGSAQPQRTSMAPVPAASPAARVAPVQTGVTPHDGLVRPHGGKLGRKAARKAARRAAAIARTAQARAAGVAIAGGTVADTLAADQFTLADRAGIASASRPADAAPASGVMIMPETPLPDALGLADRLVGVDFVTFAAPPATPLGRTAAPVLPPSVAADPPPPRPAAGVVPADPSPSRPAVGEAALPARAAPVSAPVSLPRAAVPALRRQDFFAMVAAAFRRSSRWYEMIVPGIRRARETRDALARTEARLRAMEAQIEALGQIRAQLAAPR